MTPECLLSRVRYWFLSWAIRIQSTLSYQFSLRSILILFSNLRVGFSFRFFNQFGVYIFNLLHIPLTSSSLTCTLQQNFWKVQRSFKWKLQNWDHERMILDHYLEQRKTVNNEGYSDMFQNRLKPAAGSRRRGLLSSGVCLQRDNGRPHSASHTVKQIHNLKLEVLPHSSYLPDLATRDFHLFWPLKDALRGCHLRPHEEVK